MELNKGGAVQLYDRQELRASGCVAKMWHMYQPLMERGIRESFFKEGAAIA